MEAKDAVAQENPFNPNAEEQAERLCWAAYKQGKQSQAKISFKLGMQEVAKWVEEHTVLRLANEEVYREWQAFLKERLEK